MWIADVLRPHLQRHPHILRDSQHLLAQLRGVHVPATAKFIKFDIKDFFMSGDHAQLIHESSKPLDGSLLSAFRIILGAVLRNQLVAIDGVDNRAWNVAVGTGMGLLCSGEVSDMAFYYMVEHLFLDNERIRSKFGILYYGRFKDDGLLIVDCATMVSARLVAVMKLKSRFFRISVESVSWDECNMLDVTLYKGAGWQKTGHLDYRVHVKSTSIYQPLAATSAHPLHVHMNWPRAMIARFRRLCKCKSDYKRQAAAFESQLIERDGHSRLELRAQKPRNPKASHFSYVILPHFAEFEFGRLGGVVEEARERVPIHSRGDFTSVGVGFRLIERHLCQKVQQLSLCAPRRGAVEMWK